MGGGPKWVPQAREYLFHWAILQRTWKRALFCVASRSVGLEQNVCRDLNITSEFPSLMSLLPQKPFPHGTHPPGMWVFRAQEAWCLCRPPPGSPPCGWGFPLCPLPSWDGRTWQYHCQIASLSLFESPSSAEHLSSLEGRRVGARPALSFAGPSTN